MFDNIDHIDRVTDELRRLLVLRGKTSVAREEARVWSDMLARNAISWEEFRAAADVWIDSEEFYPSPADVMRLVMAARAPRRVDPGRPSAKETTAEWDRAARADAADPRFGPVLLASGEPDPDWPEDGQPAAWIRKLAHDHGLCSKQVAQNPERAVAAVPLLSLYASAREAT